MAMHHALNYRAYVVHPIIDSVHLMNMSNLNGCFVNVVFRGQLSTTYCWIFVISRIMINRLLHPLLHVRRTDSKHTEVLVFTQMTWLTFACLISHVILFYHILSSFSKCNKHEARQMWIWIYTDEKYIIKEDAAPETGRYIYVLAVAFNEGSNWIEKRINALFSSSVPGHYGFDFKPHFSNCKCMGFLFVCLF